MQKVGHGHRHRCSMQSSGVLTHHAQMSMWQRHEARRGVNKHAAGRGVNAREGRWHRGNGNSAEEGKK